MADKRDYYQVLGVEKSASDSDIKSAFRRQAKSCHPDMHPGDKAKEEQFKELNEAYEVLSDGDKRAKYDRFGHAAFDPAAGGNPYGEGGFGDFTDIFSSFFGGGFGGGHTTRSAAVAGDDLRYNLALSFEESAFGITKEVTVAREEQCASCGGSGAKAGTQPSRCTTCNGTGQVQRQQEGFFGLFTSTRPCPACGGAGKIISNPCTDCRGAGRVRKNTKISVKIPAGIDHGQTLIMRGEGAAGYKGGPRGNLHITVSVRPHKQFKRRGFDLLLDMHIPFVTAALGDEITVPTLGDAVRYNIPAGTQNGTSFRLKEQGIQRLNASGKGDLFVNVTVDVPQKLTEEQKDLLIRFAQTENGGAKVKGTEKKSFFKK